MAEISKETRDAVLRDLADEDLVAEQQRRKAENYVMPVSGYNPIKIRVAGFYVELAFLDSNGHVRHNRLFTSGELREVVRRLLNAQAELDAENS